MPDWLLPILVGGVIVSLIGVIYANLVSRVNNLERWRNGRPSKEEILTISQHYAFCNANTEKLQKFIKEELDEVKKEIRKVNGIT